MPWCPKCGSEYPEDVTHCPACDRELVEPEAPSQPAKSRRPECLDVLLFSLYATFIAGIVASMLVCMCHHPINAARFIVYPVFAAVVAGFRYGQSGKAVPRVSTAILGWLPASALVFASVYQPEPQWVATNVAWSFLALPAAFWISTRRGSLSKGKGAWKQWLWLMVVLCLLMLAYGIIAGRYGLMYGYDRP